MSQTTVDDRQLLNTLHAFGREWIGVGCGDADVWGALHRVMPEPWRPGFMFMGVSRAGRAAHLRVQARYYPPLPERRQQRARL